MAGNGHTVCYLALYLTTAPQAEVSEEAVRLELGWNDKSRGIYISF